MVNLPRAGRAYIIVITVFMPPARNTTNNLRRFEHAPDTVRTAAHVSGSVEQTAIK